MQTHDDKSHQFFNTLGELSGKKKEFLEELEDRANKMRESGKSQITGGKPKEEILAQWKAYDVGVVVRPDDPQGILRISVGGGSKTPINLDYCTIRGDIGDCIKLLERAILAIKAGGNE